MKTIFLSLLIILSLQAYSQRTVRTDKAKYNCSEPDKIWFAQKIYQGDTSYIMQLELDSKDKLKTNEVIIYFQHLSYNIDSATVESLPQYVVTYGYRATVILNQELFEYLASYKILGYSIGGSYQKINSKKYATRLRKLISSKK